MRARVEKVDALGWNKLYGVIFDGCTFCNSFTSFKTLIYLSLFIEGYFWYFFGMTACFLYLPLCLCYKFVDNVTLTLVILSKLIILRDGITRFSVYIYIWYILIIFKSVWMAILLLIPFLQRGFFFVALKQVQQMILTIAPSVSLLS